MTLVEFLASSGSRTWRDWVLATLYWHAHFKDERALTGKAIREALQTARIPRAKQANVLDVLNKAGALVDAVGESQQGRLWSLTPTGEGAVRALAGLPETQPELEHGVEELRKVAATISDADVREYIEEAVLCLSVGALRASIVFTWVGATRALQDRVWSHGPHLIEPAAQKYFAKTKIGKFEDLAGLKEATLLDVARDLGDIDKAQWTVLKQCLDTRNQCGHPNQYRPGVMKAKSHIEDIVGILF